MPRTALRHDDTHPSPAVQYIVPESASEFIHEAICRESQ